MQNLITDIELDNIFNQLKQLKEEESRIENEIVTKCDELINKLQYYNIHLIKEAINRNELHTLPKALYKTKFWCKNVDGYDK